MKEKTPYAPVSVTQMLLHLQAEWAGARGSRKEMLRAIHRMVGSAHSLARLVEDIIADAPPDQQEKALKELRFYKATIGGTMKEKPTKVDHGMLLDGKSVMDDALVELLDIRALVPEKLHDELDTILEQFEETLAGCDVSERYEERRS